MLSRNAFAARFGARALFGMIHLGPLPGAPLFTSFDDVLALALHRGEREPVRRRGRGSSARRSS